MLRALELIQEQLIKTIVEKQMRGESTYDLEQILFDLDDEIAKLKQRAS